MKKKKKKRTGDYIVFTHATLRAIERYNFYPDKHEIRQLVESIQDGSAKFIKKNDARTSTWEVDYDNRTFKVIYDKRLKSTVEMFPCGDKDKRYIIAEGSITNVGDGNIFHDIFSNYEYEFTEDGRTFKQGKLKNFDRRKRVLNLLKSCLNDEE